MNTEDLAFTIISLRQQIATLTAERDEARELYCSLCASDSLRDEGIEDMEDVEVAVREAREQEVAESLGWDCYKEDGK